jgi:hypothetical protein
VVVFLEGPRWMVIMVVPVVELAVVLVKIGGSGGGGIGRRMGPGGGRGIAVNGDMVALPPPKLLLMLPQGFDPTYGAMGRFSGFPGGPGPIPGMMQQFPPAAPHVNPVFFG